MFADIRTAAADWPDAQRVFLADGDALALAGNLPKDKEKLLLQLREAMAGQRALRSHFMRGL